jgi:phosphoglucomutase
MSVNPHARQPAEPSRLIDMPRLVTAYYTGHPDPLSVPSAW